eukprot:355487-Chlamydomonas_euryale.AAC.3
MTRAGGRRLHTCEPSTDDTCEPSTDDTCEPSTDDRWCTPKRRSSDGLDDKTAGALTVRMAGQLDLMS